ncbi:hypothetical protein [uncultured Paraglaciecola sp.]|uniref:hypothetical protein n=1 Tax=uncultured Paraglaciecola sp. TaxID=1765024 RepID=UPI0026296FBF|nr:hypothetical protein [uncultured Paraglaciecola sp.]
MVTVKELIDILSIFDKDLVVSISAGSTDDCDYVSDRIGFDVENVLLNQKKYKVESYERPYKKRTFADVYDHMIIPDDMPPCCDIYVRDKRLNISLKKNHPGEGFLRKYNLRQYKRQRALPILNKFRDGFPTGNFLSDEADTLAALEYVRRLSEDFEDLIEHEEEGLFLNFLARTILILYESIKSFHEEKDCLIKSFEKEDSRFYFRILTVAVNDNFFSKQPLKKRGDDI